MADVRSGIGAATTGVFGGPVGNQVGTPLYVDLSTGDISVLLPGDVIYTIPTGTTSINVDDADLQLANQVFARRDTQLSVSVAGSGTAIVTASVQVDDANLVNAVKSFLPIIAYPQDVANANVHNANRALDRQPDMRAQTENDARTREVSDLLKTRLFTPDPKTPEDQASRLLQDRAFNRGISPFNANGIWDATYWGTGTTAGMVTSAQDANLQLAIAAFQNHVQPVVDVSDANTHLSNRVFDRYIPPLQVAGSSVTAVSTVTVENADLQNAVRSFHPIISYPTDFADSNLHTSDRVFDRTVDMRPQTENDNRVREVSDLLKTRVFYPQPPMVTDLGDAALHISDRVFDRQVDLLPRLENQTRVEEVSNLIKTRSFTPAPKSVPDVADANLHMSDRVFDRQIDRIPQIQNDALTAEASNILKQRVFNDRMPPARVTTFSDADLHLQIRSFDRTIGIMPQATVVAYTVDVQDRSLVIAQQSMGNHDPVQPVFGNADRLVEDRVFDRDINLFPVLENQMRVQEVSDLLKTRLFSPDVRQAVLGNASTILESMAFLPRPRAPYWT